MAVITYNGLKTTELYSGSLLPSDNTDTKPRPTSPLYPTAADFNINVLSGPVIQNDHPIPPVTLFSSTRNIDTYPIDTVRGSIYYDLEQIDLFITEDTYHTLNIWNAYEEIKTITSISVDSVNGTDLAPIETPQGLANGWLYQFQFIVYETGPPVQDTTYTFTIGGQEFSTQITGLRILPFLFPINWENNYKLTLTHNTVIEKNKLFREQRRPLQNRTFKSVNVGILPENQEKQDAIYTWIHVAKNKIMAVPLYQEAMFTPNPLPAGTVSITVYEDIQYYKFLNEGQFILIVNHQELTGEVKRIANINTGTKTITLQQATVNLYNNTETVIYPIFFSTLNKVDYMVETDIINSIALTFAEYIKGVD